MPLIVFDLDGTLVDSRRDLATAVNLMLTGFGVPALPEAQVTGMVGEGARVLVERALRAASLPPERTPEALDRFLAFYGEHLLESTRPYEGIPALLDTLQASASLAVLTNKPTRASLRLLEGLSLKKYFFDVVGGDGHFPRKPDPAALLHLIDASGASLDESALVGDSLIDVQTAQAAGVRCCLVRYGFGFPSEPLPAGVAIADRPAMIAGVCLPLRRRG